MNGAVACRELFAEALQDSGVDHEFVAHVPSHSVTGPMYVVGLNLKGMGCEFP